MGQEYIMSAYMRRISNVTRSKLSIMQAEECVLAENHRKGDLSLMTEVSFAPTGDVMETESLVAWIAS